MRAGGRFCGACGSVGMSCVRFTPGIRSCWSVLRSVHACCLPHSAKQDGLRDVAFLFRRVEIAIRAFSSRRAVIGLGWFTSGLYVSLGRSRRRFPRQVSDGDPEEVQEATGKPPGGRTNLEQKLYPCAVTRNANAVRRNRVASRSCSSGIVTAHSQRYRGEYAGAARPRLRQRVFDSLDSLHLDRGVSALHAGKPCAFYAAAIADRAARPYRRS